MPDMPHVDEKKPDSADSKTPEKNCLPETREVPWHKIIWSGLALLTWILLFSAGLLIETFEYRYVLSPIGVSKQLDSDQIKYLKSKGYQVIGSQNESTGTTDAKAITAQDDSAPKNDSRWHDFGWLAGSFLMATICYTPINLALLALTAGLVGGWASNITAQTMPEKQLSRLSEQHPRRILFLQEPPISAALRGFIVYLCVIGGLFVVMDDPFKDPTSAQYIRLGGLLSVMAFIVGYDASRLEDWIRAIPGPRGARSTDNQTPPSDQSDVQSEDGLKKVPKPKQPAAGQQQPDPAV